MANFNRSVIVGRVISDPEVRPAGSSGSTVAKFRLACGRQKKNPQTGQWESLPNSQLYIDCEAWHRPEQRRNLCDVIARFVQKGKEVLVDGSLVTDEWEDKNGGGKRSKIKLVVENLELLGEKGGGEREEQPQGQQSGGCGGGYGQQGAGGMSGDDVPF